MMNGFVDGSGTRRVVQILCQLGVSMVSEDPETYDIHADSVGGWPVMAHPLLQVRICLYYHVYALLYTAVFYFVNHSF
jgi:hypothetical protein